jgi:Sensors of blue-light using FAD
MHKIIYASQATRAISDRDLEVILETSRRNNTEGALTGLLLYCAESFLQIIEGDLEPLTATYERIGVDDRHGNLRRLAFAPIDARKFGEWTMGFEHVDEARLMRELPGFRPETTYPLVSANLITNATVAETLLSLYAKNE